MAMKKNQNFEMAQGDYKELDFTVKNAAGVVVNIAGATINWMLTTQDDLDVALLSKATGGSGITITDGAAGECQVALDPLDTKEFDGVYHHELQLIDGSGNPNVVAEGTVEILESAIQ
jgi:hypothetical protein